MIKTTDSSFTLKSEKYNQCYHSVNDGALKETMHKHVLPAFELVDKMQVNILDICFGLGYNTFASLLHKGDKKINIYSPELDEELVNSLIDFEYPKEFEPIKEMIKTTILNKHYKDENCEITIIIGDAREFIKNSSLKFDIIYQDAFSADVNPELWSFEYFSDLSNILKKDGIITTYSVATPVRLALHNLGFNLFSHNSNEIRKGTIASKKELSLEKVDFEAKLKRVTNPQMIRDKK
jgi:tRNA U34 5-methylaminomethyl-2-thiouridine-forming methyltransferase MnmC